jgi:hypothetical protein
MDRGGVSDFAEPLLRVLSRAPAGRRARIVAASSRTHVSKVNGRWQCVLDQSNDDGDTDAACVIELDKMRDVFFHEIVLFGPPNASRDCVAIAVLADSTMVAYCRVGVDSA